MADDTGSALVRQLAMGAAFSFSFNTPIIERLATIGKYDGKTASLTIGTVGGRLMVHVPTGKGEGGSGEIRSLNIQKTVTALTAGNLNPKKAGDQIIIGTQTSLSAYDFERNSESFFKEMEGVSAVCVGVLEGETPLAIAGSNSSVMGYDAEGKDQYWTVTSDNISALAVAKWAEGKNMLLVGTDDSEIRLYDGPRAVSTIVENSKATQLVSTGAPGRFAYALANGTVGVYQQDQRVWKFKSKHSVTSISVCDVNFDGVPEIIVGWDNGKFEVRADGQIGKEVIFKESFNSPIAAVLSADYRGDNRALPIVCTADGNVSGFVAMEQSSAEEVEMHSQRILAKQMEIKQALISELSSLESQIELQKKGEVDNQLPSQQTAVTSKVRPNSMGKCLEIVLAVTERAVIQGAIVTAPQVFGTSEANFYYSSDPSDTMVLSIAPEKDVDCEVQISVFVGTPQGEAFQVHDLVFKLPKFSMYIPCTDFGNLPEPEGYVATHIGDNQGKVSQWLQSSFSGYIRSENTRAAAVEAKYVSLRDGGRYTIVSTSANNGEFQIKGDRMDVVGEMIQNMGQYMGIQELSSTASFPADFEKFKDVLSKVDELNGVRMKLTAEMADSTQLVKALVIKAEDGRILGDMKLMRKMYGNLFDVNKELIHEYMKRANNHNELLAALKEVHAMIERASNLRIGKAKAQIVSECRLAIKNQNKLAIFNVIRNGSP